MNKEITLKAISSLIRQRFPTFLVCKNNRVQYIAFAAHNSKRFFLLLGEAPCSNTEIRVYDIGELHYDPFNPSKYRISTAILQDFTPGAFNDFFKGNCRRNSEDAKLKTIDWTDIYDDAHYLIAFTDWLRQNGYRLVRINKASPF